MNNQLIKVVFRKIGGEYLYIASSEIEEKDIVICNYRDRPMLGIVSNVNVDVSEVNKELERTDSREIETAFYKIKVETAITNPNRNPALVADFTFYNTSPSELLNSYEKAKSITGDK